LHYCAEPFANDGTAISSLVKALKRSMAAEFSRELGEKVSIGKTRLVEMGFWVGGPPGYGYRRLMVTAKGKPKQLMRLGEHKSLTTDRVILVPGPRHEIEGLRAMFAMAGQRKGCTEIARELNRKGFTKTGKPWSNTTVYNTVTNPKYTGVNVWHRTTQRLRTERTPVEPKFWAKKAAAFPALVDQRTFDLAQARLLKIDDLHWTDEQILRRIRRLWKTEGRITENLLLKARNMPATATIHKHFGSYRQLYKRLGYPFDEQDFYRGQQFERSMQLRRKLISSIKSRFPQHIEITHLPKGTRSVLRIDNTFIVSVLLSRTKKRNERVHWVVEPSPLERSYITLFCKMSPTHDRALSFHIFPRLDFKSHRSFAGDPWLRTGIRLRQLEDFYATVNKLWAETRLNSAH
jgi:Recombinase